MDNKELSPEERLAAKHREIYSTLKGHYVSLRRLLMVAVTSIDASIEILDMSEKPAEPKDTK